MSKFIIDFSEALFQAIPDDVGMTLLEPIEGKIS
jgi:hypothetical protein